MAIGALFPATVAGVLLPAGWVASIRGSYTVVKQADVVTIITRIAYFATRDDYTNNVQVASEPQSFMLTPMEIQADIHPAKQVYALLSKILPNGQYIQI